MQGGIKVGSKANFCYTSAYDQATNQNPHRKRTPKTRYH